jgi:hypothetical protein
MAHATAKSRVETHAVEVMSAATSAKERLGIPPTISA